MERKGTLPRASANDAAAPSMSDAHQAQRRLVLSGMLQLTHMLNDSIRVGNESDIASNADALVLLTLYLDGPQRPRELTALTGLTRGGTTNLIDRLESSGLVERRPIADDRRGLVVAITEDGMVVTDRMAAAVGRGLTFAAPLIESWKEHFVACGIELGRRYTPRGGRQTLEHMRRLGAAGASLRPIYAAVFAADDPSPYLTMHVLLLATEPGGTRPTWITDAAHLSSASTSDLLDRMERDDLVVRIAGAPPDRRVTVVTATERGRAALDEVIAGSDETMRASARALFPTSHPDRPRGGRRRG